MSVNEAPNHSGALNSLSETNLTGRKKRCVEHYKVPKEHPVLYTDESRDMRCGRSEKNLTRTSDRKSFTRLETVKGVFATIDHSRDDRCEYPDLAKKHSDVTNTVHMANLCTACGSDHHICIAPEPALNETGV